MCSFHTPFNRRHSWGCIQIAVTKGISQHVLGSAQEEIRIDQLPTGKKASLECIIILDSTETFIKLFSCSFPYQPRILLSAVNELP